MSYKIWNIEECKKVKITISYYNIDNIHSFYDQISLWMDIFNEETKNKLASNIN